jgi:hypothetical protein
MKLSKPQSELLESLLDGPRHVADYYKPFQRLMSLGLVRLNSHGNACLTECGESIAHTSRAAARAAGGLK